jgi:hypothetical protein
MEPTSSTVESMPFLHANQVFTIIFVEDFTFSEVRAILDRLLERNAFGSEIQDEQGHYLIDVDESSFQVWVAEMEVIIMRC